MSDNPPPMSAVEIVETPEEAREQELEPLIVREPLERFLDEHGLGSGPVEVEPIGEGFGKPTGYLDRQLRRFGGLWEHNKTRELPRVQEVGEWLAANKPDSPPATIVHGDYRLGNTMFGPGAPARLIAIFDWEMATIGDPLADVGYLSATWSQPGAEHGTMFDVTSVTHQEGSMKRHQ